MARLEWFPPICRAQKCSFLMTYDVRSMSRVIEHNGPGEAVLLIPDAELATIERRRPLTTQETIEMHLTDRIRRWTTMVHAYEDGRDIPEWAQEVDAH